MIDPKIKEEILTRLKHAEKEHSIKILYACESGSRAWGFASPDSDYDVRFIYAHEKEWYLSFDVESKRDVVEYPIVDEIDCSGWDIRKALYLFTRTNGALLEWFNSPIKYIDNGDFSTRMRELAPLSLNKIALCYHYSHMARRNAKEHLFKEQVKLKKYFYVLRPLLAIRFIEQYSQPPPVEFDRLVKAVAPDEIIPGIERLLESKRYTPEVGFCEPVPEINEFIQAELDRHGESFSGQGRPDLIEGEEIRSQLNEIFKAAINT